jgi:hypothetical protein
MVRAKFTCICVDGGTGVFNNEYTLRFVPVTSGSAENEKFFAATPAGELEMQIVNEETAKQFKSGQEYYIDITPVQ